MLIVCPSCGTCYEVELASLPPGGRRVRCVRCRSVWRVEPSRAEQLMAAAEAIAPSHEISPRPTPYDETGMPEMADAEQTDDGAALPPEHGSAPEEQPSSSLDPQGCDPASLDEDDGGSAAAPAEVESPPVVPVVDGEAAPAAEIDSAPSVPEPDEPPEDIETYAARRARDEAHRRRWRWPLSAMQATIVALALCDAMLLGWRADVVRLLPQTASFYAILGMPVNLRGLIFDEVSTTLDQHEGVPILIIDGKVANVTRKTIDVPRLRFVLRNAARQEIYSWTAVPPRTRLPPGEGFAFRSRVASPPAEASDVLVRFLVRQDIISTMR